MQTLRSAAASWEKTPFAYFSRAKGPHGGVDCVGFVEEIMVDAGAIEPFTFPRTGADYSRHVHNDRILNVLRGKDDDPQSATVAARFAELSIIEGDFAETPMPGDILILKDGSERTGLGVWHMPVMMTQRKFFHCVPRLGVCEGNIDDPTWRNHLVAHFRARAL